MSSHPAVLDRKLQLVTSGKVKPVIETYPLARINDARERLESHKVRYRAVVRYV